MSTRSKRKSVRGDQRSIGSQSQRKKRSKSQHRTQRKTSQNSNNGSVRSFKTGLASKTGKKSQGSNESKSLISLPSHLVNVLETPNPFQKLLSSKKVKSQYPQSLQLSIGSMLKSCIEYCINQKNSSKGNKIECQVTSTDLFGVFTTLLSNEKELEPRMAIVILLSYILNRMPLHILQKQFKQVTPKIGVCLQKFANHKFGLIGTIDCVNILLKRVVVPLTPHSWNAKLSQKLFQGILVFAIDERDDVRSQATKCVLNVLNECSNKNNEIYILPKKLKDLMHHFIRRELNDIVCDDKGNNKMKISNKDDTRILSSHASNEINMNQTFEIPSNESMKNEMNDNNNNNNNKGKNSSFTDINLLIYICQLLTNVLSHFSLRESSELIQLLYDIISFYLNQSSNIQKIDFNLQQMFLKLIKTFVENLPQKMEERQKAKHYAQSHSLDNIKKETESRLKEETGVDIKDLASIFEKEMNISSDQNEEDNKMDFNGNDSNNGNEDSPEKCTKFVMQLYDIVQRMKPHSSDVVGTPIYYETLGVIVTTLYAFNKEEAILRSVSVVSIVCDGFESNKSKIVQTSCNVIITICKTIVNDELINDTMKQLSQNMEDISINDQKPLPALQRIVVMIQSLLHYRYKESWIVIFGLCAQIFRIFGQNGFALLRNMLQELGELRCMDQPLHVKELEHGIGAAIRFAGPKLVLDVIPLNLPSGDVAQVIKLDKALQKVKMWMMPLLKNYIQRTEMAYFGQTILPMAEEMMKQSMIFSQKGLTVHSRTFESFSHRLWETFPAFCNFPTDCVETFPSMAEGIGLCLEKYQDYRKYLLLGLCHLIEKPLRIINNKMKPQAIPPHFDINRAQSQIDVIKTYSKNFLPILFNIIVVTSHDERTLVLTCVEYFAEITDNEILCDYFRRTMVRCMEDDNKLLTLHKEMTNLITNASNNDEKKNTIDIEIEEDTNQIDSNLDEHKNAQAMSKIQKEHEELINRETAYLVILRQLSQYVDLKTLEQYWSFLKQQFSKPDMTSRLCKLLYKCFYNILTYNDSMLLVNETSKGSLNLNSFLQFLLSVHDISNNVDLSAKCIRFECIKILLEYMPEISDKQDEIEFLDDENSDDNDNDNDTGDKNNDDEEEDIDLAFIKDDSNNNNDNNNNNNGQSMEENKISDESNEDLTFLNAYPKFIGELMTGVACQSEKVRNISLQILEMILSRLEDISNEMFESFYFKLLSGLTCQSSNLQCATITSLSYLLVKFEMRVPSKVLSQLLQIVTNKIINPSNNNNNKNDNVEIYSNSVVKACLNLIKIIIREMPTNLLEKHLPNVILTLLQWSTQGGGDNDDEEAKGDSNNNNSNTNSNKQTAKNNKFRSKVSQNLDLLLKRFGYEKISLLVPTKHQKLLKYLRKRAANLSNRKQNLKELKNEISSQIQSNEYQQRLDELPPSQVLAALKKRDTGYENEDSSSDEDNDNMMDGVLAMNKKGQSDKGSKKSNKSMKSRQTNFTMRLKIDGINSGDVMDLLSRQSVNSHLISVNDAKKLEAKLEREKEKSLFGDDDVKTLHNNNNNNNENDKKSNQGKKKKQQLRWMDDGRLLIMDSDDDSDIDGKRKNQKTKGDDWKNLSDNDADQERSTDDEDSDMDYIKNNNDKNGKTNDSRINELQRALSQYGSHKGGTSDNGALSDFDTPAKKRRRVLDNVKNDAWKPGELQPYSYHVVSPALLSKKKKHASDKAFDAMMGSKRKVNVRTDGMQSGKMKVSRTRRVGKGRFTLKRSQVKAKQKHLEKELKSKEKKKQQREARTGKKKDKAKLKRKFREL